jgi:hypothetical protein
MAEDKLHEKRLKERARRNGMAKSIDQMRLIVPELMDAKKVYSQAKVVAIALQHIYDLQRENGDLRQRLGLKPREQELRTAKGKRGQLATVPTPVPPAPSKREAPAKADERPKKRRRVDDTLSTPAPINTCPTSNPAMTATPLTAPAMPPPPPMPLIDDVETTMYDPVMIHSNTPSSFEEDESLMVSDTPLTLSPRREHDLEPDPIDLYSCAYAPYPTVPMWEEHESPNAHISDSYSVDFMLQNVLSGAN